MNESPFTNDIALLRLHRGLNLYYSPYINSICWPSVTPPVGSDVIASGWGIRFQHFGRLYGSTKLLHKVCELRPHGLPL